MSPQAALDRRIARYREMTTEQRVFIALRLHELVSAMARVITRRQRPSASEAEVVQLSNRWLEFVLSER